MVHDCHNRDSREATTEIRESRGGGGVVELIDQNEVRRRGGDALQPIPPGEGKLALIGTAVALAHHGHVVAAGVQDATKVVVVAKPAGAVGEVPKDNEGNAHRSDIGAKTGARLVVLPHRDNGAAHRCRRYLRDDLLPRDAAKELDAGILPGKRRHFVEHHITIAINKCVQAVSISTISTM